MIRKLLSAICCVIALQAAAQGNQTGDSLLTALKTAKEDTNKAIILGLLCRNNMDMDKSTEAYAKQMLELSKKLDYETGLTDAYNILGIVEDDKANYSKALELYNLALKYAQKNKLDKKKASIDNNIGLIYWKIGDQQKALTYYYDALRVFEKLDNKKLQANVLSNIGLIHSSLHDQKKALEFQKKALALRIETSDEYGIGSTYNNIAKSFTQMGREDSSRYYISLAIPIQEKIGDKYGLAISIGNMGLSYTDTKNYDSAIYYLDKSIALRKELDDKLGLIFSYHALGECYFHIKQYAKAKEYEETALAIARDIKSKERMATVMHSLAGIYATEGNYEKAYEYMTGYSGYQLAIYDTLKSEQAQELAVKYEVEKKDLQLEKDKAEIQNKTLALSQRNTLLSLLGILLLATAVTAYLLYNRYKLKQEGRLQQEIIRQQDLASKAIIEAEERERKRIAGDLHDGLGQLCSAIKMNLSSIERQISFTDKETALSYEKTIAMTDQACKDVRTISHQMMPNILLKTGLASAVRDFLDKIDARVLQVSLVTFGLQDRLESNTEMVLYRVIQETVNNVIKHAGANKLDIQLSKDEGGIYVTIEDNGTGFDVNDQGKFDGIGLKNIAGRVGFLKGTVEFDSSPGRGTVVSVWVPYTN